MLSPPRTLPPSTMPRSLERVAQQHNRQPWAAVVPHRRAEYERYIHWDPCDPKKCDARNALSVLALAVMVRWCLPCSALSVASPPLLAIELPCRVWCGRPAVLAQLSREIPPKEMWRRRRPSAGTHGT